MSGPDEAQLRQAARWLMEGQEEALAIVRATLEAGDDALADLQDVLEGTLEDARADLGIEEGEGA
jgi:hypothetical protein